jgi:hypothetical protein
MLSQYKGTAVFWVIAEAAFSVDVKVCLLYLKMKIMKLLTFLFIIISCSLSAQDVESIVEIEGFYTKGFEMSNFDILNEDNLESTNAWVRFSNDVYDIDTLQYITRRYPSYYDGIYLRAKAIKKTGALYGYGHMGCCPVELTITEVITVDSTRTRRDFIMAKAVKDGYYVYRNDTLYLPLVLKKAKQYLFKGKGTNKNYELVLITKDLTSVLYYFKVYNGKNLIHTSKGDLPLKLFHFLTPPQWKHEEEYEAEYGKDGSVKFNFLKEKNKGRIVIDASGGIFTNENHHAIRLYEVNKQ